MDMREILHFSLKFFFNYIHYSITISLHFFHTNHTRTHKSAREEPNKKKLSVCDFRFEISRVSLSLSFLFSIDFKFYSTEWYQTHAFCQFSENIYLKIEFIYFLLCSKRALFVQCSFYLLLIEFTANKRPCKFVAH